MYANATTVAEVVKTVNALVAVRVPIFTTLHTTSTTPNSASVHHTGLTPIVDHDYSTQDHLQVGQDDGHSPVCLLPLPSHLLPHPRYASL